jgi:Flp pilus assembly secretin CpaC
MSARLGSSVIALAFCCVALFSAQALAESSTTSEAVAGGPISVKVNMARILKISAPAATVVIGNPGVADVTIQDPRTLILTGKSYGQTNMIVLDSHGQVVVDTPLEVVQSQADTVTVYNSGARSTLACAPTCQPMVMLGDEPGSSQALASSMSLVQSLAH